MLLQKKSQLYNKYRYLLLRQSMVRRWCCDGWVFNKHVTFHFQKESPSCEHVMLGRMFLHEETNALKSDRELVASGRGK